MLPCNQRYRRWRSCSANVMFNSNYKVPMDSRFMKTNHIQQVYCYFFVIFFREKSITSTPLANDESKLPDRVVLEKLFEQIILELNNNFEMVLVWIWLFSRGKCSLLCSSWKGSEPINFWEIILLKNYQVNNKTYGGLFRKNWQI